MDRVPVVNCCFGLLSLLVLQGALNVEGRSIFTPGNQVFNTKEDADAQSKILALLLQKSLVPIEQDHPLGLELANKLAELEQLRALKEDLELEREIAANLADGKSIAEKKERTLLLEVLCLRGMQEEEDNCEILLQSPT